MLTRQYIVSVVAALAWAVSASLADAASFAGYAAVPQLWSYPDRIVIAPDRRWLVTTTVCNAVQIVDLASGVILRTLVVTSASECVDDEIAGVGVTDDSAAVVLKLNDGTMRAWNAGTGQTLGSIPDGVVFTPKPSLQEKAAASLGAYNIAVHKDAEGVETISISSGSKTIAPCRFQDPDPMSCGGGGLANIVFDGEHLVFSRAPGNSGPDEFMPAIAFRLEKESFRELWRAPCDGEPLIGGTLVTADAALLGFYESGGPMNVWRIAANRLVATFPMAEGLLASSANGETLVASTFAKHDKRTFTLLRDGNYTAFDRPADEFTHLFVSPNGRWLAASTGLSTTVWSLPEGVQTVQRLVEAVGIANNGSVLERKQWKDREFHGHEVPDGSEDGRWLVTNDGIIFDTLSGRIVANLHGVEHIFNDGRVVTSAAGQTSLFDLATGRTIWTLKQTPNATGYVMSIADGCVQVSPGSERFVRLVRGFESRDFDSAAHLAFSKPGCKGVPEVSAANENASAAERARIIGIANADAGEQVRLRKAAEVEAAQQEAFRRVWIAGAPAREEEARRAAAMVSDAYVTLERPPASTPPLVGKVSWSLDKSAVDADVVGVIEVPDLGFTALLAIDQAHSPAPTGSGVISIHFEYKPRSTDGPKLVVLALGSSETQRLSHPSHIALHRNGPSDLPASTRLDPLDGPLQLARLQPSTWIDVPLIMEDGAKATLSIAIGAVGRHVIDDVIAFKKKHP